VTRPVPGASQKGLAAKRPADPDGRQEFRSPSAVAIWWLWVLFAVGNVIDLAIQGRDHISVVAAFTLLAVTGVVYVIAQRPRIVAEADGLTIVNPVRVHRVGWAAVTGIDTTDLLRIRCEWPAEGEAAAGKRAINSWAVRRTSRRAQIAAEGRANRQVGRGSGRIGFGGFGGLGGFGSPPPDNAPPPAPLGLDAAKVIAALTERAEKARAAAPDAPAVPPRSQWHWPAVAAVIVPALALLVAVLA
jgi:hypothetical protein